jgi:hypothetical protein
LEFGFGGLEATWGAFVKENSHENTNFLTAIRREELSVVSRHRSADVGGATFMPPGHDGARF